MGRAAGGWAGIDAMGHQSQEFPALASVQRVAMALLLLALLLSLGRTQAWTWAVMVAFTLFSVVRLWRVTTGQISGQWSLPYYWAAAALALALAQGTEGGVLLLVLLLYPLTMCTILHGLRPALLLGACCGAAWLVDFSGAGFDPLRALPAAALLILPVFTAAVTYPLAALRQRVELVAELEGTLDARRGLVALGQTAGERLRQATAARRVLVCHRDAEVATVLVCDVEDGSFEASAALSGRVLALLQRMPALPLELQEGKALDARGVVTRHAIGGERPADALLKELAQLLEAQTLQLAPVAPGHANTGWFLVAYGDDDEPRKGRWPLQPVAAFASAMRQMLQQASYVDSLQAEIGAHERSRIGRDLHDSAIQPYLGLKFAIEGLALRSEPANPLHAQIQELRIVCESELIELRKTVSALRAGDTSGENSLATSLQRQCNRFARLFDIQVDLHVPADLTASRNLISALLHMVNEALNNVRRHTTARQVWISLSPLPGALSLVIRDDAGQRSGKPAPDFEPRSLSERARELGGALQLRRHGPLDTEILITLPN